MKNWAAVPRDLSQRAESDREDPFDLQSEYVQVADIPLSSPFVIYT